MKDLFGNEKIRTLGLYQPYASLMLHGKIESRWVAEGKKPPFPLGKYLIYSTKKAYSKEEFRHVAGQMEKHARALLIDEPTSELNGFAICIGDLTDVSHLAVTQEHRAFIDTDLSLWQSNDPITIDDHVLWGLTFENVQRIKPFPFRGKQGVGILTEAQKKLLQSAHTCQTGCDWPNCTLPGCITKK